MNGYSWPPNRSDAHLSHCSLCSDLLFRLYSGVWSSLANVYVGGLFSGTAGFLSFLLHHRICQRVEPHLGKNMPPDRDVRGGRGEAICGLLVRNIQRNPPISGSHVAATCDQCQEAAERVENEETEVEAAVADEPLSQFGQPVFWVPFLQQLL